MPSHLLHTLFAENCARSLSASTSSNYPTARTLGAQGPDIFFHNRRRKPSGVFIGARVHKHNYGTLVAEMVRASDDSPSPHWSYCIAFATHAILDRYLHPYINYFGGWQQWGNKATAHLRYMHPFFERVLDTIFWKRMRGEHPSEVDFVSMIELPTEEQTSVLDLLAHGLSRTYDLDDESLRQRVQNAYDDSLGFYRHSSGITLDALAEQHRPGSDLRRWLSLVHPPFLPQDIDYANEAHRRWCLPCDEQEEHHESVWELYETAHSEATDVIRQVEDALQVRSEANLAAVATAVGSSDLSSTRAERCIRRYSDPLPLNRVIDSIEEAVRNH